MERYDRRFVNLSRPSPPSRAPACCTIAIRGTPFPPQLFCTIRARRSLWKVPLLGLFARKTSKNHLDKKVAHFLNFLQRAPCKKRLNLHDFLQVDSCKRFACFSNEKRLAGTVERLPPEPRLYILRASWLCVCPCTYCMHVSVGI